MKCDKCGHGATAHDENGCIGAAFHDERGAVPCPCTGYERAVTVVKVPACDHIFENYQCIYCRVGQDLAARKD